MMTDFEVNFKQTHANRDMEHQDHVNKLLMQVLNEIDQHATKR